MRPIDSNSAISDDIERRLRQFSYWKPSRTDVQHSIRFQTRDDRTPPMQPNGRAFLCGFAALLRDGVFRIAIELYRPTRRWNRVKILDL